MTSPRSFPAEDAESSIQRTGLYTLEDSVIGNRITEFADIGFPTKTPPGLEFTVRNSCARQDIRRVLISTLDQPHLGTIKVLSHVLPSDYVFRFHNGSAGQAICLLVFLWSPGSVVCFYGGSIPQSTEDISEVSESWGLLATPKLQMKENGISENPVNLEKGGLVISDSRIQFSIVQGYCIMVGFPTTAEVKEWGKMVGLPYSDAMKAKVDELEVLTGIPINCPWPTALSNSK